MGRFGAVPGYDEKRPTTVPWTHGSLHGPCGHQEDPQVSPLINDGGSVMLVELENSIIATCGLHHPYYSDGYYHTDVISYPHVCITGATAKWLYIAMACFVKAKGLAVVVWCAV